jgi:hypothetical protein
MLPEYVVLATGSSLVLFFGAVLAVMLSHPVMFLKKHGRFHRIVGLTYFLWMLLGFVDAFFHLSSLNRLLYDTLLGLFGVTLTLTAAFEFQHKHVKNVASGTLDKHATVTFGEMIEHSFYQGLNLLQVLFLHLLHPDLSLSYRLVLAYLVTLPWLARDFFPVNKFSDNYTKIDEKSTPLVRLLYRLKKYQYVFYKHFLLHGLNISAAMYGLALPDEQYFRLYWMSLNASYVMEFFLQTLVKKNYMGQNTLLWLQKILMAEATVVSLYVLQRVSFLVAGASLLLNFLNRKHDVLNTSLILVAVFFFARP